MGTLLAASSAGAKEPKPLPTLHLSYESPIGCPDESRFRKHVALRLGYDPFVDARETASRRLTVTIGGTESNRSVEIVLADEGSNRVIGQRRLSEPAGNCDELVQNSAFAASLAIDPTAAAPSPPPEVATAPRPQAPATLPPSPAEGPIAETEARNVPPATPSITQETPAPGNPIVASLRIGGTLGFGILKTPSWGITFGGSLRRGALSIGLEGRSDFPSTEDRVRTSLLVGSAALCGHALSFDVVDPYACAVFYAGVMRGESSGISNPRRDATAYAAVAPRIGADVRVHRNVALGARLDAPFVATSTELTIDGKPVWVTPSVGLLLGVYVSWTFR